MAIKLPGRWQSSGRCAKRCWRKDSVDQLERPPKQTMSRKPRIKPYREPGGGWGAALATGKVLLEQKVLFKGAAALYRMNKPGGFKCPSCAWPDPKPENADPIVICENG